MSKISHVPHLDTIEEHNILELTERKTLDWVSQVKCAAGSILLSNGVGATFRDLTLHNTVLACVDVYEPEFFFPLVDWSKQDAYSVKVTFDDSAYDKDLFYFCHVSSAT